MTLRNLRKRAVFKIQEGIVRGFREALQKEGFTEIHSPKIVAQNAEGGANLFRMEYFGRRAYLAQSPQFYKQAMVPVYERVFEIGPVFRAEKHNTQRHLNEYTSMDFEMGFIDGFEDIMQMETKVLQNIMAVLKADYAPQLAALHVSVPDVTSIPAVRFDDAKRMVSEKYGRAIRDPFDLEPEEEQLISRLFAEEYGSEFVFVTHYPSKKRPFYAADDPGRSALHAFLRPALPRAGGHDGRPAHSRLRHAGGEAHQEGHEPGGFCGLSDDSQIRHVSARRSGLGA